MKKNRTQSALESFYKVKRNFRKRLGHKSSAVLSEGGVTISGKLQGQRDECAAMEVASSSGKKQSVVRVLVLRCFFGKHLDNDYRRPSSWWPQ